MLTPITFLDCTLRDGGYYNNWNFSPADAEQLVRALNNAGAQIIEIGYKSPYNFEKFYGLFKNCNEKYLSFLSKKDAAEYAFMIDVKEFVLPDGKVNYALLDQYIKHADQSVFTWVRLATHFPTVEAIPDFVAYFRARNYKIGYNLMGGSLLSRVQIKRGAEVAGLSKVDVFYFADSFGSFYPEDIRENIRFIRKHYEGVLGIHTHDNQGLAYANTLVAIEEGVTFVDATLTGMGRGAGNLMTEQFLLGYSLKYNDSRYNPSALLPIIESHIGPLKEKHKWGQNYTYMYSGLLNIHPSYTQHIAESQRFTYDEQEKILTAIPTESRKKFSKNSVDEAVGKLLKSEVSPKDKENNTVLDINNIRAETAVIIARGSQAEPHTNAITSFAEENHALLIECNDTGFLGPETNRMMILLNHLKIENFLKTPNRNNKAIHIVTGTPFSAADFHPDFYPFKIGTFNPEGQNLNIPDYDAGIYAIALAIRSGIKMIYLAGFDGFTEHETNLTKSALFMQIKHYADKNDIKIAHITPTNYKVFNEQSVYYL